MTIMSGAASKQFLNVRRILRNEGGVVLLAALLAVAVLFVLVTSVSTMASGQARATPYWRDKSEAFYTAESGLNHCLYKLNHAESEITENEGVYGQDPPTFTSWEAEESIGLLREGTSYQVWVTTDAVNSTYKRVTVLAEVNGQSHLLNALIRHNQSSPFYDEDGDGWGETGECHVSFPNLPNMGTLHITANQTVHVGPGEFLFDKVIIDGGGTLILDGQTTFWIRESLYAGGTSQTNVPPEGETHPTHNFIIYLPTLDDIDQTVTIDGAADFYGFIYAPGSRVLITGNSDVYGMVVGEEVTVDGNTTYDPEGEGISWPASTGDGGYVVESVDG